MQYVQGYYSTCPQIDQYNRYRQAADKKKLDSGRVKSSILAMVIVDRWLSNKVAKGLRGATDQGSFYEKLAEQLILNNIDSVGAREHANAFQRLFCRLSRRVGVGHALFRRNGRERLGVDASWKHSHKETARDPRISPCTTAPCACTHRSFER